METGFSKYNHTRKTKLSVPEDHFMYGRWYIRHEVLILSSKNALVYYLVKVDCINIKFT
jgi:hypothetical protein